jgi:HK97 family phage prohead protease
MMQTKTADFDFSIKAVDEAEEGSFEGLASPFGGQADAYGDVIEYGAYSDTLARHAKAGTMPLMLWSHDPAEPIGVWTSFEERKGGLFGRGKLLKGIRRADEAHILLRHGAVRGLSIGFRPIEQEPDGKVNRIKKIDLLEVSIVSFPAAPKAQVTAVKSDLQVGWEAFCRALREEEPAPIKDFERLLRDAGCPKAAATFIASKGYAAFIRGEPGEEKKGASNADAIRELRAAMSGFSF